MRADIRLECFCQNIAVRPLDNLPSILIERLMFHLLPAPCLNLSRQFSALAFVLAVVAVMAAPPALAQQNDLVRRLDRLERDIGVLNQQVFRGQAPTLPPISQSASGGPAIAGLEIRVQQLEASIAQVTGQLEEMTFRTARLQETLEKMQADNDYRFQQLEQGAAASSAPAAQSSAAQTAPATPSTANSGSITPPAPTSAPSAAVSNILGSLSSAPSSGGATVASDPERQYNDAFALLQKRDFPAAEKALADFIRNNPDHRLLPNAQYWLGETHYARNDFRSAAVAFAEGYQAYPKANKAPDSLFKLGQSLAALNQNEDACLAYARLRSEYQDAPANLLGLAQRQMERLRC